MLTPDSWERCFSVVRQTRSFWMGLHLSLRVKEEFAIKHCLNMFNRGKWRPAGKEGTISSWILLSGNAASISHKGHSAHETCFCEWIIEIYLTLIKLIKVN